MSRYPTWSWRGAMLAYLVLGAPLMLFGGAWTLNDVARGQRVELDTVRVAREMTGRVGALKTLTAALTASPTGVTEDDGGALLVLAARLREQLPFVTAIGQYRRIALEQRAGFVERMSERGLYNFRIRRFGAEADGESIAYPISMLEPATPTNVALLGADLGAAQGLAERLDSAAADNTSILFELPSNWPGSGQLMLFHPTYLGTHAPTVAQMRSEQSDGGFWVMIDPERLFGDSAAGVEVSVTVGGAAGESVVYRQAADVVETLVLERVYAPVARRERWRIGSDWLEVSMTPRPGIAPRHLITTGLLLALITCALGSLLFTLLQRHRQLESQARHREALYRARETSSRTLEAIKDAVIGIDHDAVVQHLNPAAERLLGDRACEATGVRLGELLPLLDKSGCPFDAARAIEVLSDQPAVELDLHPVDDTVDTVFRATLTRTTVTDGGLNEHIVVLRDVSIARRLNRALERQANHDALTGCTNRRHFERRLEELVADRSVSGRSHSVLYMDLDQFKVVNDTCGHAAGDRLLVELTARLRKLVRHADVLSRLGGDEFGLIVVDACPEQARRLAESIHDAFQTMVFAHEQKVFPIHASLGLVHVDDSDRSVMELLAAADMACYAAKENGRNELVVYQDERERMAMRSTELDGLSRLQKALDDGAFRLHLQPIASIGPDHPRGHIAHFEFLLRMADEQGLEIAPWQIVQAAERYGLMRRLDRWIITHALQIVARHAPSLPSGIVFSINLSGQSAADPSLIDFITESFARFSVEPSSVGFELTETAAISSFNTAVELVERIRALGSQVSLDDFGSGLSSFGYLKNLPIDVLKIDGQFVREIVDNPVDRTMVKAIAEIARSMRIRTVAEFVENQDIVEVLIELGIDFAQGYHIARPMPVEQALRLLENPDEDSWAQAA